VTISDDVEAEDVLERRRKEQLARDNALPSWITDSTIPAVTQSFDMPDVDIGFDGEDVLQASSKRVKLESDDKGPAVPMSFKMEEEEEDELEFEDVV
jgi:transcription initiation factor TFIIE subunit alpha